MQLIMHCCHCRTLSFHSSPSYDHCSELGDFYFLLSHVGATLKSATRWCATACAAQITMRQKKPIQNKYSGVLLQSSESMYSKTPLILVLVLISSTISWFAYEQNCEKKCEPHWCCDIHDPHHGSHRIQAWCHRCQKTFTNPAMVNIKSLWLERYCNAGKCIHQKKWELNLFIYHYRQVQPREQTPLCSTCAQTNTVLAFCKPTPQNS